ncbi:MAG TPA: sugar transferase [Candidatus Acidoferrales bacterium]|nr:sugar transferase [Candidatus Acidoferrales bacterium]
MNAELLGTQPPVLVYRENIWRRRVKRAIDVSLVLVVCVPAAILVALACIAIFMEDGRPFFFRQKRSGRFERVFTIWKLRTMRQSQCFDASAPTSASDSRITRVGSILRKTSIDELPQLFNVLRGDMSLVGPRPEQLIKVKKYIDWQHLRHLVVPGITCVWQTTCRKSIVLDAPQATVLDLEYIRRISVAFDLALIVRTIRCVISAKGAY